MSRVGKCLIATPNRHQGFFQNTVVWIYEDSPSGTSGVGITNPTNLHLRDLAAKLGVDYPEDHHVIYKGGPVASGAVMMLHTADFFSSNTVHTGVGLNISSDELMIKKLITGNTPTAFRLTAGASCWAPGQLDREMSNGTWLLAEIPADLIFNSAGSHQWRRAIEHAGRQTVANYF